MALIVLYSFPLFTFDNPPNLGHLNNLHSVQIILAYFFLGSSESKMSVVPVVHSGQLHYCFLIHSQELTEEDKYLSQELRVRQKLPIYEWRF